MTQLLGVTALLYFLSMDKHTLKEAPVVAALTHLFIILFSAHSSQAFPAPLHWECTEKAVTDCANEGYWLSGHLPSLMFCLLSLELSLAFNITECFFSSLGFCEPTLFYVFLLPHWLLYSTYLPYLTYKYRNVPRLWSWSHSISVYRQTSEILQVPFQTLTIKQVSQKSEM